MRIILGISTYSNMENIGNEIALRREEHTTFVPESKGDADKLNIIIEQFLGVTNKKDD